MQYQFGYCKLEYLEGYCGATVIGATVHAVAAEYLQMYSQLAVATVVLLHENLHSQSGGIGMCTYLCFVNFCAFVSTQKQ